MRQVRFLGVRIDDLSLQQAADLVVGWLVPIKSGLESSADVKKYYIVTPNPEFLVAAQDDLEFKQILNGADLAIPDGVGLKLSGKIQNTTPGVELVEELCKLASEKGLTVGLIGGRGGVAKEAAKRLMGRYPELKVVMAEDGPEIDINGREVLSSKYQVLSKREKIFNTQYLIPNTDVLFIGYGMIKQEKWIAANLDKLPVKVVMGVGGSFDYLSGRIPRAPLLIRKLGFEWLFRLITEPWRFERQLKLLKFIWLLLGTASFLRPQVARKS